MPLAVAISCATAIVTIAVGWSFYPVLTNPMSANKRAGWKVQIGLAQTRRAVVLREHELSVAMQSYAEEGSRDAIRSFNSQQVNDNIVGDNQVTLISFKEEGSSITGSLGTNNGQCTQQRRNQLSSMACDDEEDEYKSFLDKFLSVENEYDLLPYPAFSVVLYCTLLVTVAWMIWASRKAEVYEYR
jgi:hypothetical protein